MFGKNWLFKITQMGIVYMEKILKLYTIVARLNLRQLCWQVYTIQYSQPNKHLLTGNDFCPVYSIFMFFLLNLLNKSKKFTKTNKKTTEHPRWTHQYKHIHDDVIF